MTTTPTVTEQELSLLAEHVLHVLDAFPNGHVTRQEAKELANAVLVYLEVDRRGSIPAQTSGVTSRRPGTPASFGD
jgi:hypothetical protein